MPNVYVFFVRAKKNCIQIIKEKNVKGIQVKLVNEQKNKINKYIFFF